MRRGADALRAAAAEPVSYSASGPLRVSASFGVAVFPQAGEGVEALLVRADRAMYEARRDGRDAVRFFSGDGHPDQVAAGDRGLADPAGAGPADGHL